MLNLRIFVQCTKRSVVWKIRDLRTSNEKESEIGGHQRRSIHSIFSLLNRFGGDRIRQIEKEPVYKCAAMSFSINLVEQFSQDDNLLILAYKNNLSTVFSYLSESEKTYLEHAITNGINHVFFPNKGRSILVHFVDLSEDTSYQKELLRIAGNDITNSLAHYKIKEIVLLNTAPPFEVMDYVEGMILGGYKFTKYFSDSNDNNKIPKKILIPTNTLSSTQLSDLTAVLEATFTARDLVNEPQSYLTAAKLGEEIEQLGEKYGFSVEIFNKAQIQSLKMGGLLAVNKGSFAPPRFCIMEWKHPKAKNEKPIVLVGKGVVFDTGGINLKPTPNSLATMKCDMAGAAAVIGSMVALAKSQLPLHVIGLVPATDNRVGNDAYLPGDVITMYDGTTVEVLNTDAEGRLILADALHYAKKYDPELVLDFATLTGAAVRSLGQHAICYMGTATPSVKKQLETSGNTVFERLVEFPLWQEYGKQLKSNIADLRNVGGPTAGMITAGKFLEHFTDYPWLHFDIAGPAYMHKKTGYRTKEGTGVGVRLTYDFLKNYLG